jgi:glutamate synthase domain-containing protein 3
MRDQDHGLEHALDQTLVALAEGALEDAHPVVLELPVRNVNRTVGTLLGSEVTRRYGAAGLPEDTVTVKLTGSAGQSLGAFLPPGVTIDLVGDANDYVGKGLSGGKVVVRPPEDVLFLPEDNVIAGNTLMYGATSGEVYLRGRVGERFAARNSGALAVTEGVGDHACEYMTGGRVVVLGPTGRNMAAGMSGGIAYVLGLDPAKVNTAMVELQPMDPEDLQWLRGVIARHAQYTGSTVATSVLADWPRRSAQFTKIMPTDYQRVLQATRMAKAEGRDVDTAIMEATRG